MLKAVDAQLLDQTRCGPHACVGSRRAPGKSITLNIDATLVAAHSDKELAVRNHKHGHGFHPMSCYLDETREALEAILRPGERGVEHR